MMGAVQLETHLAKLFTAEGSLAPEHLAAIAVSELDRFTKGSVQRQLKLELALANLITVCEETKAVLADRAAVPRAGDSYRRLRDEVIRAREAL